MDNLVGDSFTSGFISGALFVLSLAPVFFLFGVWKKKFQAIFKPQKVVLSTKKSPFQVFSDAVMEITAGIFMIMILVFVALFFL